MVNSWEKMTNELVKKYFKENLPLFSLNKEFSYGPYWNIEFLRDNIKIEVDGDIGFIIYVYIDNSKYSLWQYDRNVNSKMSTSKENILYQLEVLKRFLNEVGY